MPPPPMYAERATPIERGTAEGIDVLLAVVPAAAVLSAAVGWMDATGVQAPAARYVLEVLRYLAPLAYTFYFEGLRGATPGKMAVGLVIGRHDGTPADRWTLAFRWMTKQYGRIWLLVGTAVLLPGAAALAGALASFATAVLMVGVLRALDEDRRTWTDQWAGTAVWKKARGSVPRQRPRPQWLPPEIDAQWPARPNAG